MVADLRPALRTFLLGESAIAAVVETRVFPMQIPQGIKAACIVCTRVSGAGDYTMTGPSLLTRPRYQIDAWSPDVDVAVMLANLVKDRIDGFSGLMGAIAVQGVFCADEREVYEEASRLFGISRDYFIWHDES